MKLIVKPVFALVMIMALFNANAAEKNDYATLKAALMKALPGVEIKNIKPSGVPGMVELSYGSQILYATEDGRYVFDGDIVDLVNQVNITELSKKQIRKAVLDELGVENTLAFTPENKKHYITVFTDVDCPYCRRLHGEMDQYLDNGIEVRYLFLPFKGKASYATSVSVWCSDNPQQAMNDAKAGKSISSKDCETPIKRHMEIARDFGIRGTPAIVFEDGMMVPGYKPAKDVVKYLKSLEK